MRIRQQLMAWQLHTIALPAALTTVQSLGHSVAFNDLLIWKDEEELLRQNALGKLSKSALILSALGSS